MAKTRKKPQKASCIRQTEQLIRQNVLPPGRAFFFGKKTGDSQSANRRPQIADRSWRLAAGGWPMPAAGPARPANCDPRPAANGWRLKATRPTALFPPPKKNPTGRLTHRPIRFQSLLCGFPHAAFCSKNAVADSTVRYRSPAVFWTHSLHYTRWLPTSPEASRSMIDAPSASGRR